MKSSRFFYYAFPYAALASFNSPKQNFHFLTFRGAFSKFWDGFGDMFGGFWGRCLGCCLDMFLEDFERYLDSFRGRFLEVSNPLKSVAQIYESIDTYIPYKNPSLFKRGVVGTYGGNVQ